MRIFAHLSRVADGLRARSVLISSAFRRAQPATIVLAYHGIRAPGESTSWLHVDVRTFRAQLRALSAFGRFIRPEELELPSRPSASVRFLLTFDDGYRNALELAVPVLLELRIPALFFVSTRHLATGEPFWFERVVASIQASGARSVDLRRSGLQCYSFRRSDGPGRWSGIQRLLVDLKQLGDAGDPAFDRVLAHLQTSLGTASARPPFRPEDIETMAATGLCHFGSHGHEHSLMTRMDTEKLRSQLALSRSTLSHLSGTRVTDVAYPNGNVDANVVQACRAAGYERGFTTTPGVVDQNCAPFEIPRLLVGGYDSPRKLALRAKVLLQHRPAANHLQALDAHPVIHNGR